MTGVEKKVYDTLLLHEFMKKETIESKLGVPWASISGSLTKLRRKGLVEFSGSGRTKTWKKHDIKNPMYPPQPDIVKRKSVKKDESVNASFDAHFNYVNNLINKLTFEINQMKKLYCSYEKSAILNGEQLYRKKSKVSLNKVGKP